MEKIPRSHFIIIDSAHVRLEDEHLASDPNRQAFIKYYAISLAGRARAKFEQYCTSANLINKENINELIEGA